MVRDEISDIIQELKALKLREAQLLEDLESAHLRALSRSSSPVDAPNRRTRDFSPNPGRTATPAARTARFNEGDHIVIINKVIRPLNRPTNRGDRTAVVTKVTKDRVYLRTSNGTNTWRAPNNVSHRVES